MSTEDASEALQGLSTRAIHAGAPAAEPHAPLVNPIVQSTTFYTAPIPEGEVLYTRYGTNPNHRAVARTVAALEGAEAALVTGSGMAAIAMSLLALLRSGEHIVAQAELYGGTLKLLRDELPRLGIETSFVEDDEWRDALREETRVLLLELPSNPTLRVRDIGALVTLARERNLHVLVDATFATPVNFRPLEHGADVVVHSATKYLAGHSDVIAGVVAGSGDLVESVRERLRSFGPSLDPGATWLLERGLKTLAVRVQRQNQNALALARWLMGREGVAAVQYPGLPDHPDHSRVRELFDGFGGMLAFRVEGGDEAALAVLGKLKVMRVAPSLGGVETLVSMPRYTSHAALSRAERHAAGIGDGYIRLSVGIEDVEDLQEDLHGALAAEVRSR